VEESASIFRLREGIRAKEILAKKKYYLFVRLKKTISNKAGSTNSYYLHGLNFLAPEFYI
jgi:hypothetical protein